MSSAFLPGCSFSNCLLTSARNLSLKRTLLSVLRLYAILMVSESLPEPDPQAVREPAARRAARTTGPADRTVGRGRAVGRTGTTSWMVGTGLVDTGVTVAAR